MVRTATGTSTGAAAGAGHPASRQYAVRPPAAGCAGPTGRTDRRSAFPEPSPRFNADRRYAVRSSEIGRAQRCRCGFRAPARCRSETGAPSLYATWCGRRLAERAKTMAANSVRCPRDRGESVKGGLPPPFHKSTMTNRNSPPRAAGAQGSFDCRREAPGPRTGPQAPVAPLPPPRRTPISDPLDLRSSAPLPERSTPRQKNPSE